MSNIADSILETLLVNGITGVNDNLQNANDSETVIYKLNSDQKSKEVFIERMTKTKAKLVIVNDKVNVTFPDIKYLIVPIQNFLEVQKKICDHFYPIKSNLKMIGITGTNGKTTSTHLSLLLLEKLKVKALGVGTLGLTTTQGSLDSEFSTTTPSYIQLRRSIYKHQKRFDAIVMEVSSHALKQERIYRIEFDAAAWTNFTQDHLDYHKTMEDYFESKMLLIKRHLKKDSCCFVPSTQHQLLSKIKKIISNHYKVEETKPLPAHWVNNLTPFFQNSYNQENLAIAYSIVSFVMGAKEKDFEYIKINELSGPDGRFSTIEKDDKMVVVDYAHTPDAIINVAKSVSVNFKDRPISILFGCGGNRDKTKRPLMAKAALDYSNKIYVTSDNPRFEDPNEIINDILKGHDHKIFVVEADRKSAIVKALDSMVSNEILLILGKGHEKYQEINGEKIYFSDYDVVKEYFDLKGSK